MKHFFLSLLIATTLLSPSMVNATEDDRGDNQYRPLTRSALSMLYWKMGNLDVAKDYDIDTFMLINKCQLYKDKYNDDFAWHEIRQKARASIEKNKSKFNTHLEVVQPIILGRYDVANQEFPLIEPINTSKFEVEALDAQKWECFDVYRQPNLWKYPHKAILEFPYPLILSKISVPIEEAEKYNKLYEADFAQAQGRPAYLTQQISVFDADNENNIRGDKNRATLNAILERIEIHADIGRTILLYSEDKRKKKSVSDKPLTPSELPPLGPD